MHGGNGFNPLPSERRVEHKGQITVRSRAVCGRASLVTGMVRTLRQVLRLGHHWLGAGHQARGHEPLQVVRVPQQQHAWPLPARVLAGAPRAVLKSRINLHGSSCASMGIARTCKCRVPSRVISREVRAFSNLSSDHTHCAVHSSCAVKGWEPVSYADRGCSSCHLLPLKG